MDVYTQMMVALKKRYPSYQENARLRSYSYMFFEELRVGAGFKGDNEQRIDAWIMQEAGGNMKIAVEVKTSRADFLREIKNPLKRRPGMRLSNRFYFYAPKGVIKPEEVPPECGLLEYNRTGKEDDWRDSIVVETVVAPWRDVFPPTWSFINSIHRNLTRQLKKGNNGEKPLSNDNPTG